MNTDDLIAEVGVGKAEVFPTVKSGKSVVNSFGCGWPRRGIRGKI
jgi:hypothetical protein